MQARKRTFVERFTRSIRRIVSSTGPPVSTTSTSCVAAQIGDRRRWAAGRSPARRSRRGARSGPARERVNLLLSVTRMTRRAFSMIARDTCTSRMSKSSSVPSSSIAEVPMTAVSTRNCRISSTVVGADDAAVARPDAAAGDDHLDRAVAIQLGRDIQVVGDDQQARLARQRARHLLGRGADIDEQRRIVRDQPRPRPRRSAACAAARPACALRRRGSRRRTRSIAPPCTRVITPRLAQLVQIAADGLRRDRETRRQFLDRRRGRSRAAAPMISVWRRETRRAATSMAISHPVGDAEVERDRDAQPGAAIGPHLMDTARTETGTAARAAAGSSRRCRPTCRPRRRISAPARTCRGRDRAGRASRTRRPATGRSAQPPSST